MNKYLKFVLVIVFIVVIIFAINYLFFTETGQIRVDIKKDDVVIEEKKYYLNVDNYKDLKIPEKEFKKIDFDNANEYEISFTYNTLFKKGNIDYLKEYGKKWNKS